MAKKGSKKNLKSWECEYGCDVSGTICKHLEDKLRPRKSMSLKKRHVSEYILYHGDNSFYEQQMKDLEAKLLAKSMPPWAIELAIDRFVSKLTIDEIIAKYGYANKLSVHKLLIVVKRMIEGVYKDERKT